MRRHRVRRSPTALVILVGSLGLVAGCWAGAVGTPPPCVPNAPDACTTVDGVALGRLAATLSARRPDPTLHAQRPDRDGLAVAWGGLDRLHHGHPLVMAVESYELPPIDCGPGCIAYAPVSIYLFRFADAPPLAVVVSCPGIGACTARNGRGEEPAGPHSRLRASPSGGP